MDEDEGGDGVEYNLEDLKKNIRALKPTRSRLAQVQFWSIQSQLR